MRAARFVFFALLATGCGALAGPLGSAGVTQQRGVAALPQSHTAWYVCFRGQYRELPNDVDVVARYQRCQIVLSEQSNHAEMRIVAHLRLGSAEHLRSVDPGLLLKAMVVMDPLHLVVEVGEGDQDRRDDGRRFHEDVGCESRSTIGHQHDLDCPLAAVPLLLAHEDVESIKIYNRYWVRWR